LQVKSTKFNEESVWTLNYYDEFEELLFDTNLNRPPCISKKFTKKIYPFIEKATENFRVQINYKTVPLLIGVFFDEHIIRVCTPRLNSELFLVGCNESKTWDFKKHAEAVAGISVEKSLSLIELITIDQNLADFFLPTWKELDWNEIDNLSNDKIEEILKHLHGYKPSLFERLTDAGLALTAQFALLRIHLLKFLAILPSLSFDNTGTEVKRILQESLRRLIEDNDLAKRKKLTGQNKAIPSWLLFWVKIVYRLTVFMSAANLTRLVRFKVRLMAKRFIAGEDISKAEKSFKNIYKTNRDVTLDQLGELVVSEKEAGEYCHQVLCLIKGFSKHIKKGDLNQAGINRAHVSIKVSALCSDFNPEAVEHSYNLVYPRLKEILIAAKEEEVFINIDAEHYHYRDLVFKIYSRALKETTELKGFYGTGIVLQGYLRDASEHLDEIILLAKECGFQMPIRLVKGAYWDAETIEAEAHSFDAPEFLNKEETDIHFRQLIIKIFENNEHLKLCLASHNFADHCFAEATKELYFRDVIVFEHQCLHMTYEALSTSMAKMGWAVRNYVPIGSLLVGMAYLVRRIMENSSQVGVLTIMRSHKKQVSLVSPVEIHKQKKLEGTLNRDQSVSVLTNRFFNIPPVRLYLEKERNWMNEQLDNFKSHSLNKSYPAKDVYKGEFRQIVSSSNPDIIVGTLNTAIVSDAELALTAIKNEFISDSGWTSLGWEDRVAVIVKAVHIITMRRLSLACLITYEAGKTIIEALGDIDEAIDFLNFYIREEARLQQKKFINEQVISRGPTVVIAPWNFPLAIPCGMSIGPLIAGNTVILKSAEQTPLIAQSFVDILHEAGVPESGIIHLPGKGSVVGDTLVNNPDVACIVFTGSKAIGMQISAKASKRLFKNPLTGNSYPVKVITEMGGKNAIIVTANAELDETVSGVFESAYGHSGQKCSACSRVIVDNRIKDHFISRLKEASLDVKVGEAYYYSTILNPVVSQKEKSRIQKQVQEACNEALDNGGQVIVNRSLEKLPGFCVGPAIIDLPWKAAKEKHSYAVKEIFGPVLHIVGYDGLDQAIEIFNSTDYALTGGIFSQSEDDIEYLSKRIESGNVYINRNITGARVAIEPFGGFKLSGTGPKAGGRDYLPEFHILVPDDIRLQAQDDSEEENGSNYSFDLCKPSGLAPKERMHKVYLGINKLLANFEYFFQDISLEGKEELFTWRNWPTKDFLPFLEGEHPNRSIPGQLSYNDYSLSSERCLVLGYFEKPSFDGLKNVLAALLMGVGVTVLARNQKSFLWWGTLLDYFKQAGISKGNFDVFFTTEELLLKTITDSTLSHIVIDGGEKRVSVVLEYLHSRNNSDDLRTMVKVITPLEKSKDDLKSYLKNYSLVRSFAVNTMRHGAPMNIEY
jgi:RHH-type proline utilization regulon transcriptional repressor/proline dehydrogenase/delta 1-pyrroline-5-carboxylate dehydrogenase